MSRRLRDKSRVRRHQFPLLLVQLCILLRLEGGCSYRKVIAVLKVLSLCGILEISRYPCSNTVQNWVSKLGLYSLQNVDSELRGQEVVLIVDESIRKGKEKQLLILSTPYEQSEAQPLTFDQVQVVYFGGRQNWNGELIQEKLKKLEADMGFRIKAILSDEDSKLKRASRLLSIPHLNDICHAIGTCLRRTFEKDCDYQCFMKEVSGYRCKGVNQDLSYLLPPNQRSKARFLNQAALVKWAEKLLKNFEQLSDKEKAFFKALPNHHRVINALKSCIAIAKEIALPLKQQGLSLELLKMLRIRIAVMTKLQVFDTGGFLSIFLKHLDSYMIAYQDFMKQQSGTNIPVSSEIIESLFGKYKGLSSPNKIVATTKLNLEIPAICRRTRNETYQVQQALEHIFVTDLEDWVEKHSSHNQLVARRNFFKNGT